MTDDLEDATETPEEMASNFTCAMFESPQTVLKGARHMVCIILFVRTLKVLCGR